MGNENLFNKTPQVSLLICCYNGENYLDTCFTCILEQTYTNIEILFVDDGSQDKSLQKVERYRKDVEDKGMFLKVFGQENQGAGFAASLGLQNATGEFITCFDVDDYLYPQSIEKKVDYLLKHPDYTIVRTNGFESRCGQKKLFVTNNKEISQTDIFRDLLFGKTNNWSGSYMIRANALWNIYPDHIIPGSKYGQNLQLLLAASYKHKSGFVNEPLMKYIRNDASFTGSKTSCKEQYDLLNGFLEIKKNILKTLHIDEPALLLELEIFYAHKKKQMGIDFRHKDLFISNYLFLKSKNGISAFLDHYYYYSFKKNYIVAIYYRLRSIIHRHLHQ